jgi:hypothetical protein
MSLQLRSIIEKSLIDILDFFKKYNNENKTTLLSSAFQKVSPFKINLVIIENSRKIEIDISLDDICKIFDDIIKDIIDSLKNIPRIEYLLFENMEDLDMRYANLVDHTEEFVEVIKNEINRIIQFNYMGPKL